MPVLLRTKCALQHRKELLGFGNLWLWNILRACLWSRGSGYVGLVITTWPTDIKCLYSFSPAYPAQWRDQECDQKWQLISSVIWWWNTWEWKEKREHTCEHKKYDGCFMTGPPALSVTFRGRVSLCYRPPLPGNYHKLHFPCPPEPRELSGQSGRIATFIIFFFSFHRLIF